jgi:putative heme-binding domain-containing protein
VRDLPPLRRRGSQRRPRPHARRARFGPRDLLESILEPSKVISDQYQSSTFLTKTGSAVVGRAVGEQDDEVLISTSPFDASQVARVKKSEIQAVRPVLESTMPPALVNRLNEAELLDLLAFLLSGGNSQDRMFAK